MERYERRKDGISVKLNKHTAETGWKQCASDSREMALAWLVEKATKRCVDAGEVGERG